MITPNDKIKIKSLPYVRIFLIAFVVINLIGIINFPFYKEVLKNNDLYFLIVIGFSGFLIGSLLIRILKFRIAAPKGRLKPKLFKTIFLATNTISFILIIYTNYINRGIIIMMGDVRFTNYAYITLFIYIAIITTLTYFAQLLLQNKRIKVRHLAFIAMQSLSVLSMGYRSPLIILVVGCVLIFIIVRNDFQNKYKNIFTIKKMIYLLLLIALMSGISAYRVSSKYKVESYFRNIDFNYINDHKFLSPFVSTLAVFRYDQEVVKIIIFKTKNRPYYGKLALSNFLTILPGEQLGARNIIGEIVGARKQPDGKPWSITPTLQGALYVDAGIIGVFFGFFALGAFIEYIKKLMINNKDPFSIVLYVLMAVNSLMIIHTGYFDTTLFILLLFIVLLRFFLMRIKFTQ